MIAQDHIYEIAAPLLVGKLIPLLAEQYDAAVACHGAYIDLLREQEKYGRGRRPAPYVCLKHRLALSQKSFWRRSGVMLDHSMILSTESGNQLSKCG